MNSGDTHNIAPEYDLRFQKITKTPLCGGGDGNSDYLAGNPISNGNEDMLTWVKSGVTSSFGAAFFIAFFAFLFFVIVQPPFVKTQNTPVEEGHLSWTSVCVWILVIFLVVLVIPPVRKFCGTAFTTATSSPAGVST